MCELEQVDPSSLRLDEGISVLRRQVSAACQDTEGHEGAAGRARVELLVDVAGGRVTLVSVAPARWVIGR